MKKIIHNLLWLTAATPLLAASALAQEPQAENFGVHGQITNVTQWHPSFRAAYTGANSLDAARKQNETTDLTLYLGYRVWNGAEFWINPEIDQGFGLSNTVGMAGYPSGEAYKVGANRPYLRLPRAFLRQTWNLGGEDQALESAANQLAGQRKANNLIFTIGHFSVVDIFDNNSYAHDARSDFLNWSAIDAGSFDYAADPWGFTNGASLEWNQGDWSIRGGVFQMSPIPNSKVIGLHLHEQSWVAEIEKRTTWFDLAGKWKILAFVNRANMANYADAINWGRLNNSIPDNDKVRRFASRAGVTVNAEQNLNEDIAAFARLSKNQGDKEAYEFTEINQSLAVGLSIAGKSWGRGDDKIGMVAINNALSKDAQNYFSAGGMGILIGDGQLRYGKEQIMEAYYSLQLHPSLKISVDYQHVRNPAYNQDRGPVSIYAVRLHSEF